MSNGKPVYGVVGAAGFIGSAVVARLRSRGEQVLAISRADLVSRPYDAPETIVFAAGVTSDFAARPCDTFDAHVASLLPLLRSWPFSRLVYLSSTRVYDGAFATAESSTLAVRPESPDHTYNVSKIAGESLCLNSGRSGVTVVRLSNVYSSAFDGVQFLDRVVREARSGAVVFRSSCDSERDFVALDDAVDAILRIADGARERVYNVASGRNTSNAQLADALRRAFNPAISYVKGAPRVIFPPIDIRRASSEFRFEPKPVDAAIVAVAGALR